MVFCQGGTLAELEEPAVGVLNGPLIPLQRRARSHGQQAQEEEPAGEAPSFRCSSAKTDTSRRAMVNAACSMRDLWPEARTFPIRARFLGFPLAFSKISWASPAVVEMRAALAQGDLLEAGVPREDARFLLPYAFHSNFYCTLNARELCRCRTRWVTPERVTLEMVKV